ncbi:hypothetical protein EIP86_005962 [Pleurotus ostreatoroseus]|nr:hypothetical protein EIP86_005962 [Pleurotus ostreatoroseus]
MTSTPPPNASFAIPAVPNLPSPSSSRPRHSIGSSFSFGPQSLISSITEASATSHARSFALDPNSSILPTSPFRSSPRRPRRPKASTSRHPLANDTTDIFQDSIVEGEEDEEEYELGMVDRMRLWRHDALMQHLYDTAAFWGDKVVSWTNDPNDAFWLAQTYFLTHQYSRAERLLTRPFPTSPPSPPLIVTAAVNGNNLFSPADAKGKGKEIPQSARPTTSAPGHNTIHYGSAGDLLDVAPEFQDGMSRLVDMSVACRYLAAQCQMRQGKWADATEMLGEANPFRGSGNTGPTVPNMDGGIKIEASMCHLRGLLMLKLNRGDQAKNCFMEALALDVKCYESFEQLISGEMMTPDEEWEFVQTLSYKQQTPADAEFVRLIYTSRLRKYKHGEEHALARRKLVEDYGLGDNPDVLFSFADALYTQFRWADCFAITSKILSLVEVHGPTMPLHVACLYHLPHLHSKLFMLAHELVEKEPESPISWYAVGVWYLTAKKWSEARTYFRSHLPLMFVGMEHIVLSNHPLADEALFAANTMCDGDPLLKNEMGVMAYYHENYEGAIALFKEALKLAQVTQSSEAAWATTYVNLGTCYRKLKKYPEAKASYEKVLQLEPRHVTALGFLGIVYQMMDQLDAAIVKYHECLSIDPINGQILELLNLALEANTFAGPQGAKGLPMGEDEWTKKMREHRKRTASERLVGPQNGEDEMNLG